MNKMVLVDLCVSVARRARRARASRPIDALLMAGGLDQTPPRPSRLPSMATFRLEYLNTALLCAVLLVAVAVVIGVYTGPAGQGSLVSSAPARARGRTLVIPMGYYYGTFVMHLWVDTYERPFRMRVDTGSSVLTFGDLPGCVDGAATVCSTVPTSVPVQVSFAQSTPVQVRATMLAADSVTLGYIDGVPRIEPWPLQARVADDSRVFVMPLGFGGGAMGLMNQLKVRRLQIWLVDETWSLLMPCQIVLSPRDPPDDRLVILRVPLVPHAELVKEVGPAIGDSDPTYVFRVDPPPAPAAQTIRYAVLDIGSTFSFVPLVPGTKTVAADIKVGVTNTGKSITLDHQETEPLGGKASLDNSLGNKVLIIGNKALNQTVIDVDLDDGPTGTLRLMRPL
jgi:hypothetical protein